MQEVGMTMQHKDHVPLPANDFYTYTWVCHIYIFHMRKWLANKIFVNYIQWKQTGEEAIHYNDINDVIV